MSDNRNAIEKIKEIVDKSRVFENEPMAAHTSFRIGGPADALVAVENEAELAGVLKVVTELATEHILVGNGSNFLVADEGYPGIMIKLGGEFDAVRLDENDETSVIAGGAKLLSSVSAFVTDRGLAGFEFASGIPGSIGGAMFMNAGAYGGEMKDIVKSVRLMKPDGSAVFERTNEEMKFAYRHSSIQEDESIVLSVVFQLTKDNKSEIAARVAELQQKRNSKQPVNYPSAGSTFKRPVGGYAAALIDEAGLRGTSVGGAQVSDKHAGFVINTGGATAKDVLELMRLVRKTVYEKNGIMLEPEVRLINCSL
ncbi:MAG: UDP-N-acetylmuramate dehydrogenase [Prevotellaceae bacterium]|nr:UDP-N-acetylmuramate dehydrogenase [Candidatus Faecinaster equi]